MVLHNNAQAGVNVQQLTQPDNVNNTPNSFSRTANVNNACPTQLTNYDGYHLLLDKLTFVTKIIQPIYLHEIATINTINWLNTDMAYDEKINCLLRQVKARMPPAVQAPMLDGRASALHEPYGA